MNLRVLFSILSLSLFLFQCTKTKDEAETTIYFHLTDNPADYLEVNLDYLSSNVKYANNSDLSSFSFKELAPGPINILNLQNGGDTLLGSITASITEIVGMEIAFGKENTLLNESGLFKLKFKDESDTLNKIKIRESIDAQSFYNFYLDFNVLKSIQFENGTYYIEPQFRVFSDINSGSLSGQINPVEARPFIYAISNTDTLSFLSGENGDFFIRGLKQGNYRLELVASVAGYKTKELKDVGVFNRDNIDLGLITLDKEN